MIIHFVKEPQNKLGGFHNRRDNEIQSIVSALDQVISHRIGRKNCELGQNLVKHIQKYTRQLGNIFVDLRVPANEVKILDELNGLDADAVKQRDGLPGLMSKKAIIMQHTFAQIFTMHSMLVILPNPSIVVFNALRWLLMKSNLRSFLAVCSASQCAFSFAMLLCSTKLKIVMELVSKFMESRPVL